MQTPLPEMRTTEGICMSWWNLGPGLIFSPCDFPTSIVLCNHYHISEKQNIVLFYFNAFTWINCVFLPFSHPCWKNLTQSILVNLNLFKCTFFVFFGFFCPPLNISLLLGKLKTTYPNVSNVALLQKANSESSIWNGIIWFCQMLIAFDDACLIAMPLFKNMSP